MLQSDRTGPTRATAVSPDAVLADELRAGRKRLQACSRRLGLLRGVERDAAANELYEEVEQILIGLRLLEREPRSPTVTACAAKLRRAAESVQENLRGWASGSSAPEQTDSKEAEDAQGTGRLADSTGRERRTKADTTAGS